MQAGIISDKFLKINQLNHRFPQDLRSLQMKITLLHNHSHAAANSYLIYYDNFKIGTYMTQAQTQNYFPCSWFLENGKPKAYEFCDVNFEFDLSKIQQNLKLIQSKGYNNYGTTIRPIRNQNQFMTKTGHVYVPLEEVENKQNYSETAIDGESVSQCVVQCIQTGIQHADVHEKV